MEYVILDLATDNILNYLNKGYSILEYYEPLPVYFKGLNVSTYPDKTRNIYWNSGEVLLMLDMNK